MITNIIAIVGLIIVINLITHRVATPRSLQMEQAIAAGPSNVPAFRAAGQTQIADGGVEVLAEIETVSDDAIKDPKDPVKFGLTAETNNALAVAESPSLSPTPTPTSTNRPVQGIDQKVDATPIPKLPTTFTPYPDDGSDESSIQYDGAESVLATLTPITTEPPTVLFSPKASSTPLPLPTAEPSITPSPTALPWPDQPGVLSVPKINLVQQVQDVPIRNGNWDIANLGEDVGLLQATGKHPGDDLSMTFVGHVTTVWPIGGPFERIGHLSLGDEVHYQVGEQRFVYEITRFLKVHPSRGDMLYNARGDQILLVTCHGYNLLNDNFDDRLIAQATIVRTEWVDPTNTGWDR